MKKPNTPLRPRQKLTKHTVCFVILITAWTALSLTFSQVIIALLLRLVAGGIIGQPLWMLIFYILSYALAIVLLFLVPPKLWPLFRPRRSHKTSSPKAEHSTESALATNPAELGVSRWPNFVDIGLAPVGYIVYIILATVLTGFMGLFSWFNASEAQDVGFSYFLTTGDRIFAMLAVVLIAPIAEELIMRGWLYGKLRSRLGLIASILITSLTFAVLHGQWNVGVTVFALSIVLCSLREITGTIWSGMLLHILSNGIAFYAVYIMGSGFLN